MIAARVLRWPSVVYTAITNSCVTRVPEGRPRVAQRKRVEV